jgi:hypothetical protein
MDQFGCGLWHRLGNFVEYVPDLGHEKFFDNLKKAQITNFHFYFFPTDIYDDDLANSNTTKYLNIFFRFDNVSKYQKVLFTQG